MKKVILIICIALFNNTSFSQKKKVVAKKTEVTSGFAKIDNLVAEIKNGNFQVTISEKGKTSDAMIVKAVDNLFTPINCKLASFTASGVKLYILSWTENSTIKTDLKTEDRTTIYSVIYEIVSKKQVFSNYQLTNHITEKVFLDKNKTASETQEKIRREGFELTLNTDGSLLQKNKTQQNSLVYDTTKMEFVSKKK